MRPCRTGLCARSLRVYAPMPYGSMSPQFTGLCTHTVWVYAPIPYGSMRPQFTGLCAHAVWVYVSAVYGAACPYFRKLWLHTSRSCIFVLREEGFTRLRPAALPRRTFQAADIFDAGIEALCQISQVLHDDLIGAERFRAIRYV